MSLSDRTRRLLAVALTANQAANEMIDLINGPEVRGTKWYVDPQSGSDSNSGTSWNSAFASMSPLDTRLGHRDVIYLTGVLKQCWITAPAVQDVTIVGIANTPRQATDDGVANGGGATWMNPGTTASPLLHLGNTSTTLPVQGWRMVNIFMSQAGAAPCVKLSRKLTGADPSHASFHGCKFTGVDDGIQSVEASFVRVEDCEFFNFTTTAKGGIQSVAGDGVALPLQWVLKGNRFWNNVRHVVGALSSAEICDNNFAIIGSSITTTIALSLTGGKNNSVYRNMFNRPVNTSPNATLFVGGTNDVWSHNYGSDALFYGVPDNS